MMVRLPVVGEPSTGESRSASGTRFKNTSRFPVRKLKERRRDRQDKRKHCDRKYQGVQECGGVWLMALGEESGAGRGRRKERNSRRDRRDDGEVARRKERKEGAKGGWIAKEAG